MFFDLDAIKKNAAAATTEDLLDRMTVYREDMEPEALDIFAEELRIRGVTEREIVCHEKMRIEAGLVIRQGMPQRCQHCTKPAATSVRGWHLLLGMFPVFRREFHYCLEHVPGGNHET